ncbi:hypothetical protein BU23DRAFT_308825 [Bimuria novae-zelandiae CBS 107.79]|uniref:Uncharacterized protein n=1 Tax=Bimuria novae-zelandiae CBS 107.79 TaxID=1447943 RepID=A0A6A5USQ8_9PLEO|nr:hypothetical protein BU23DRAFT_308825 [Bimuria novae-zelandiae CBS 107.79]
MLSPGWFRVLSVSHHLIFKGIENQSGPFGTRHQDRYQDLLGERYKDQEVIPPHRHESISSLPEKWLLPSPSTPLLLEEPTLLHDNKRQPSLERTTTNPDFLLHFKSDKTQISDHEQRLSDERSIRSLWPLQSADSTISGLPQLPRQDMSTQNLQSDETFTQSPPQRLLDETSILELHRPDTTLPQQLAGNNLPGRTTPLATKLMCDPFVAKRRNPLAINLKRNKPFVTKRRPLLGVKRLHLFVGRRLTNNPLARRQFHKRRLGQGLSAEVPSAARSWKNHSKVGEQRASRRQKRGLNIFRQRKTADSRFSQQGTAEVVAEVTKGRKVPRLLFAEHKNKAQSKDREAQERQPINRAVKSRRHMGARKKTSRPPSQVLFPKMKALTLDADTAWTARAERAADIPSTSLIQSEVSEPEPRSHVRVPSQPSMPREKSLPLVTSSSPIATVRFSSPSPPLRQQERYQLRDTASSREQVRAPKASDQD